MIFETDRLILRPWHETDADECYKYAKDPRVGPIAGWPVHTSVEYSRQIIREVLSAPETYAIVLKETGLPIGSIGLHHDDLATKEDEEELGFWLGVPYWGQGIVVEAAKEILRHAFEDLQLKRVWCGYYDGNDNSKRVQEKLGFKYQWTSNNIPVTQMGETRKGHVNLMRVDEWKEMNDKKKIIIKEVKENKCDYMSLLLLADESETMIALYLDRGHMFILEDNGLAIAECIVTDEGDGILEIQSLAVDPKYQHKGYGKMMIDYIVDRYHTQYNSLQVGTGDSPLTVPFYERCGFIKDHVIKNYIVDHYDLPIYEGGKQLIDKVYLIKELK